MQGCNDDAICTTISQSAYHTKPDHVKRSCSNHTESDLEPYSNGDSGASALSCPVCDRLRIGAFSDRRCLFIQAQRLEPGAEVSAHRDALPYGGDRIATVVLTGSSHVRVGSQTFQVNAGDCYAIAHDARYVVEHEVGFGMVSVNV